MLEMEGSVSVVNFPKIPEVGEVYYLILNYFVVKGIARKLR